MNDPALPKEPYAVTMTHARSLEGSLAIVLMVAVVAGCSAGMPSAIPTPPMATFVPSPSAGPPSPTTPTSPTATFVPSPSAGTPSPTSAAYPTVAPGTFAWQRLTTIGTSTPALEGIAAAPAGYVVVAWPRTAWFSPDGRSWTATTLPFTGGTSNGVELRAVVNGVVGGPGGFLVVGGYDLPPCAAAQGDGGPPECMVAPISWASSDGRSWRSSIGTPIPADGSGLPTYSELAQAWPIGDGWDAAVSVLRDTPDTRGNTLLHSSDGLTWTRLASPPLPAGAFSGDDITRHGGVASASGRRLVWQVRDRDVPTGSFLSTSLDGVSWTRLTGFEGTEANIAFGIGPAPGTDGPWLLSGYVVAGQTTAVKWWHSDDLVEWSSGWMPATGVPLTRIWAAEHWRGGYIAIGQDQLCCPLVRGTWLSSDGMTWSAVGGEPVPVDAPMFLAAGPAGLVGVGANEDGVIAAWLGVNLAP